MLKHGSEESLKKEDTAILNQAFVRLTNLFDGDKIDTMFLPHDCRNSTDGSCKIAVYRVF
jgi:hypothetical protein